MVDAKPIAAKDIVAYVTAQSATRSGLKMIELQTCPKVPADLTQVMMRELQKKVVGDARHEQAQCADLRRMTPSAVPSDCGLPSDRVVARCRSG